MKQTLLLLTLLFAGIAGFAQQGPVYGQYFHNPFLYNPAFAGSEMYPVLTLTHQRQLLGVEDAPVASTITFHTPLLKNIAIGAKIYTESQGLLTNSSAQLALAYILPVNEQTNIRFGLSGGINRNQLDLSSATESQLAYLSNISRTFNQLDLIFGVMLKSKKASLGISFPNMTKRSLLTRESFRTFELEPLEHMVFTASFKQDLIPTRLLLEPVLIYERFNSSNEQRIEGGALFYFKEIIWLGGTYQYKNGLSGLFGIKIKEHLSFGYAYGMNNKATALFKNASHEVQLKIKLGKTKEFQEKPRTHTPRFQSTDY